MAIWIGRLQASERSAWEQGRLDAKGQQLGIGGWLVPISVGVNGSLPWHPADPSPRSLPHAYELQFSQTLTPKQEQRLIEQLQSLVLASSSLRLNQRPVLLLKGLTTMASLRFSLRRWRQGCPDVLLLGNSDERDQLAQTEAAELDGWVDVVPDEVNYLRYLKGAHHRLGQGGLEIPAVRALTAEQEQHCLNGSAGHYREWMAQACAWSTVMHNGTGDAPVLIDHWEGHQRWSEPQYEGCKSSTTTRLVPLRTLRNTVFTRQWGEPEQSHLALLIHAFYPEQLEQMLQPLARSQPKCDHAIDLYVSTTNNQINTVIRILEQQNWQTAKVFALENCGRDVVPFVLHLLPDAERNGHDFFIKVHTKSSPHLDERSRHSWSKHLTESLLTPSSVELVQQQLLADPSLGLLAPAGCLMPVSLTLYKNYEQLLYLLGQASMRGEWALQHHFIAGSMYAGRFQAFKSIQKSMVDKLWCEQEEGQTDGTTSHALERWLSLKPVQSGWQIKEMDGQSVGNMPGFGYQMIG